MTTKTELAGTTRLMFPDMIGGLRLPRVTFEGEGAPAGGGQGADGGDAGQNNGAGQNGGTDGGAGGSGDPAGGASGGDQGGGAAADWRAGIKDPDLKKQAERFTTVDDVIKGNLELRQRLSSAIIKPGKDAKPEEIAAYRKAMEIPETAEGYEFTRPEHIDEETFGSDAMKAALSGVSKVLHDANVSKSQAQAIWNWYNQTEAAATQAQIEADKQFATQTEAALKQEWGADTDKNKEYAKRGFEKLATDAGLDIAALKKIETKDGRFLLDRPEFSKLFAKIGREMGEGTLGPVVSDGEAQSIQSEIDKLQSEKREALAKGNHTKAQELDDKQRELYAKLPAKG